MAATPQKESPFLPSSPLNGIVTVKRTRINSSVPIRPPTHFGVSMASLGPNIQIIEYVWGLKLVYCSRDMSWGSKPRFNQEEFAPEMFTYALPNTSTSINFLGPASPLPPSAIGSAVHLLAVSIATSLICLM